MTGKVVILSQKISFQRKPLKQTNKKNLKIASRENLTTKKMSTDQICTMMRSVVETFEENSIKNPLKKSKILNKKFRV